MQSVPSGTEITR